MRPVVNTKKHFIQESIFTIAAGAIRNDVLAVAAPDPDPTVFQEVREGSIISAVYIEMWVTSDDAAIGNTIWTLEKLSGASNNFMNAGDSAALQSYDNKKNILHTQMGLVGPNTQYPSMIVKGWFKIPKSKQRFGIEDTLVANLFAQGNGLTGCGISIYKEQY